MVAAPVERYWFEFMATLFIGEHTQISIYVLDILIQQLQYNAFY